MSAAATETPGRLHGAVRVSLPAKIAYMPAIQPAPFCRLAAVVRAHSVPLAAGRARWARPYATVPAAPEGLRRAELGA
jgi:hypothetical protein